MADLPDWFTLVAEVEAEAHSFRHGAATGIPAAPDSGDIYFATDTQVLYICVFDGAWTGFDASILTQGILTLYANVLGGGFRITNIADPVAAQDAATRAYVLARDVIEAAARAAADAAHAALTTGIHGVGASTIASIANIATHTAIAAAHHARYTDAEVDAIVAVHTAIAAAHHARYTDAEVDAILAVHAALPTVHQDAPGLIATHAAIAAAHHASFTAANHTAIGNGAPHHAQAHTLASHTTKAHAELTNVTAAQHHAKYLNAEAVAAAEAAGLALASGKNINVISALTSNDTWSGLTATLIYGQQIAPPVLFYARNDGQMALTDANLVAKMPAMALSTAEVTASEAGIFLLQGFFRHDAWNWTPGGLLYPGETNGNIIQTILSGSGDQVQVIGVAITADIIYFNPSLELVEIA